ncbi:hypothetical protein PPL_04414 [Heterostelium album PN500]|uniref:Uncharacterized protein n=1 Tax=Heterostelium pallidum (strain ATCC 26659 / Pp 5 / PN500) TaxID=670386 RepID=D3B7H6_HETP5|nr:hypothetical protein PPL_04414 [Heterostelium album PN500]EFA82719.1 hypothetical protein PPL_04414 [Heterostelium album PN500]|eukprot:XP_020434836.1 hypothetical protein PPL_04414 [Heterostelium album PN500]
MTKRNSLTIGSLNINDKNISHSSLEEIVSIKSNSINNHFIKEHNTSLEKIFINNNIEPNLDAEIHKQLDGADDRSINSNAIDDNISVSGLTKENEKKKKEIVYSVDYVETNPPAVHSVLIRCIVSWIFGLIAAAYSSLAAPYMSFVCGLVYYNLYRMSNNTGRLLLPPVYTIMMKTIQIALDLICVRCAHSASNLFLFVSRIIASYYSFAVLSFIHNPQALISVVLSKVGLHIFLSLFMVFPSIEASIVSWLPQKLIKWKKEFEKGVQDADEDIILIKNEYDRMSVEKEPHYVRLHISATNLSFSMVCDLISIVMLYSFYTFGRYGPANSHYNELFPFEIQEHFNIFFIFLAICFATLSFGYIVIMVILNYIIKELELKRVLHLLSVNWYPMRNFYIMCVNFMMSYD